MDKLTENDFREYVESGGACPMCGSCNVEFVVNVGDFVHMKEHRKCCDCDAQWYELYTLTGIEPVEDVDCV